MAIIVVAPAISAHFTPVVSGGVDSVVDSIGHAVDSQFTGAAESRRGSGNWHSTPDSQQADDKDRPADPLGRHQVYLNQSGTGLSSVIGLKAGAVTRIIDGDTLDVEGKRVRLALVNTPERGEFGYKDATAYVSSKCPVGSVAVYDVDDGQPGGSYDRVIAKVICHYSSDAVSINEMLVTSGHAEILERFCTKSEFAREAWAQSYGC